VGANALLPLAGRTIPIVADEYVDPEFGTGMVKVTPAHDPNDFEIAPRPGLEPLDILTPDAHLNENVPEGFRGLDRFAGRKAGDRRSRGAGAPRGRGRPHVHTVPHCYRCDTVVEPRLSEQWFVRMKPLAEPALKASRDGTITFTSGAVDRRSTRTGWRTSATGASRVSSGGGTGFRSGTAEACGEMIVARARIPPSATCGSSELEQDPDVLDTWFSSWLWPFSVFGWPEETDDLKAFYPGTCS
jgi:valyl-tRNA synthetase